VLSIGPFSYRSGASSVRRNLSTLLLSVLPGCSALSWSVNLFLCNSCTKLFCFGFHNYVVCINILELLGRIVFGLPNTFPRVTILVEPNHPDSRRGYTQCRAHVIFLSVPSPLRGLATAWAQAVLGTACFVLRR